jgi:hypothetical protein
MMIPKIIQSQCGIFPFSQIDPADSFKKHIGGSTNARTVAENPPVNSNTIPRLHVNSDIVNVIKIRMVVIEKCRILLNGSDGQ